MMKAENLKMILERLKIKYVDKGDVLFRQGEKTADYFYIIRIK